MADSDKQKKSKKFKVSENTGAILLGLIFLIAIGIGTRTYYRNNINPVHYVTTSQNIQNKDYQLYADVVNVASKQTFYNVRAIVQVNACGNKNLNLCLATIGTSKILWSSSSSSSFNPNKCPAFSIDHNTGNPFICDSIQGKRGAYMIDVQHKAWGSFWYKLRQAI